VRLEVAVAEVGEGRLRPRDRGRRGIVHRHA
jgi:hypothetical protein